MIIDYMMQIEEIIDDAINNLDPVEFNKFVGEVMVRLAEFEE